MLHRILHSVAASLFVQITQTLIQIVSVPLLIQYWGISYYGEWLLLFTIPSYLSLSDIGLVSALSNELLISVEKKEHSKASIQLSSGIAAIMGFGLIGGLILMVVLLIGDIRSLLNIRLIDKQEYLLTTLFLVLYVILNLQQELLSTVSRAEGHNARGRVWITITRLMEFVVIILLTYFGEKALGIAMAYAFVRLVSWFLMLAYYRSWYPWMSAIAIKRMSIKEIKHLISPSLSFLLFALSNAINLQGGILLVGALLSPVHVVIYNTLRTISNTIRQMINVMTYALWPEFTRALQINDLLKTISLHRRVCQIAFWATLLLICFLEISGETILTIWTKGEVKLEQPLYTLMLLTSFPYVLWNASATVAISINRHQHIAICFLVCSVLSLVGSAFLTPKWGLSGMAIGSLIGDFLMIISVFKYNFSILQEERIDSLFYYVLTDFKWIRQLRERLRTVDSEVRQY